MALALALLNQAQGTLSKAMFCSILVGQYDMLEALSFLLALPPLLFQTLGFRLELLMIGIRVEMGKLCSVPPFE